MSEKDWTTEEIAAIFDRLDNLMWEGKWSEINADLKRLKDGIESLEPVIVLSYLRFCSPQVCRNHLPDWDGLRDAAKIEWTKRGLDVARKMRGLL